MDQYVVPVKGRTLTNSSRPNEKYSGGTIFVDHASGRIFLHNQISLRSGETLIGKRLVEREAHLSGRRLTSFHADNGVFTSQEFREDLARKQQTISFSGVGAHHQNGVAERHIKTISYLARAMLLHAALQWPKTHDVELWSFCLEHAVYIWNNLPGVDGLTPLEKWTGCRSPNHDHVRRLHPWGCPSYVLDPKLQDGKRLPKWNPRSRQGKFVGLSKEHATSIGNILNLNTKRISPQFHVLYDDFFTTVKSVEDIADPVLADVDWDNLVRFSGVDRPYDNDDVTQAHQLPDVDNEWLTPEEIEDRVRPQPRAPRTEPRPAPIDLTHLSDSDDEESVSRGPRTVDGGPPVASEGAGPSFVPEGAPSFVPEGAPSISSEGATLPSSEGASTSVSEGDSRVPKQEPELEPSRHVPFPTPPSPSSSSAPSLPSPPSSRPRRSRRLPEHLRGPEWIMTAGPDYTKPESFQVPSQSFYTSSTAEALLKSKHSGYHSNDLFLQLLDWGTSLACLAGAASTSDANRFFTAIEHYEDPLTNILDDYHPLALAAKASDADNPRWFEATRGENSEGFWEAMHIEVQTLLSIKAFDVVPRTDDMHVVNSTWAFKIKRFPSGLVRKLKARFCVRGDQQIEGVDFFDTFAPVVSWSTVRLLLILSIVLNLKTTQVDYTAAFCQAPIDSEVYISQPRGWQQLNKLGLPVEFKPDHVLRLNRSVYGLRQSPKNFFEHLKGKLLEYGFTQSVHDPCLFISKTVICLVYVDDCLFFSPDQSEIDAWIEMIRKVGMNLNVEDDVAGFLGVLLTRNEDGTISLTQAGLIQRIIAALGLEDANPKKTPAPQLPLGRDLNGPRFDEEWSYPSVVGMMMYLAANSHPDIAFAVHQCARHSHNPSHLHGVYLKHIGRYLKGTVDKGLVLSP